MFDEAESFALLGIKNYSSKTKTKTPQRGDSINYLGYKVELQKIKPQKVQIRRDQL